MTQRDLPMNTLSLRALSILKERLEFYNDSIYEQFICVARLRRAGSMCHATLTARKSNITDSSEERTLQSVAWLSPCLQYFNVILTDHVPFRCIWMRGISWYNDTTPRPSVLHFIFINLWYIHMVVNKNLFKPIQSWGYKCCKEAKQDQGTGSSELCSLLCWILSDGINVLTHW